METLFEQSLEKLTVDFPDSYYTGSMGKSGDSVVLWPGSVGEDIIMHVHRTRLKKEKFHRHDFFYFNYAYRGSYNSLSDRFGATVTIAEGDLFVGQPNTGHALCIQSDEPVTMIALLVRKEALFRTFLPQLVCQQDFFRFLLNPSIDELSQECLHLSLEGDSTIVRVLKMLVIEYANENDDSKAVLASLVQAFLVQVARMVAHESRSRTEETLAERVLRYISENIQTVTLEQAANHFAYHPTYLSTLFSQEMHKSFSEAITEQKMARASLMLESTDLSVEEIATQLGYRSASGFYKSFRQFYHMTPRAYVASRKKPQ